MIDYSNQPLSAIDSTLDSYGWAGGWRIQEDAAQSISSTLDSPPYFFDYLPFVFIIDTSTMEIVAADGGSAFDPDLVDIIEELQQIDGAS
jgi:hypothetical protein